METNANESIQSTKVAEKETRLVDIEVKDEIVSLNLMVGFLNLAHKRGTFTIDESAKIWECISKFQKKE
jgi:hypothetical protein